MNNKAQEIISEMSDTFNLAGEGFKDFYKSADKKSSGDCSQSASSGDCSQSASSGDYSQSASSGNYSQSASSGDCSQSASSGDYSQSASSGYGSQSASLGYGSKSASSGDYSQSASSGDYSQSASSGDYSQSASSGYGSQSASSGENSACAALGYRAAVKGDMGNLIMASEYAIDGSNFVPIGGLASIIDGKNIHPNRWYIAEGGKWVEVDFTDGLFGRVLSNKANVKKIKTDDNKILFVVFDDAGNSAHGKTIKEARADLVYKVTAKFDGTIPKTATGAEWIGLYRAITGACSAGVKHFVDSKGLDLARQYTPKDVAEIVRGAFGEDKFNEAIKKSGL